MILSFHFFKIFRIFSDKNKRQIFLFIDFFLPKMSKSLKIVLKFWIYQFIGYQLSIVIPNYAYIYM